MAGEAACSRREVVGLDPTSVPAKKIAPLFLQAPQEAQAEGPPLLTAAQPVREASPAVGP